MNDAAVWAGPKVPVVPVAVASKGDACGEPCVCPAGASTTVSEVPLVAGDCAAGCTSPVCAAAVAADVASVAAAWAAAACVAAVCAASAAAVCVASVCAAAVCVPAASGDEARVATRGSWVGASRVMSEVASAEESCAAGLTPPV